MKTPPKIILSAFFAKPVSLSAFIISPDIVPKPFEGKCFVAFLSLKNLIKEFSLFEKMSQLSQRTRVLTGSEVKQLDKNIENYTTIAAASHHQKTTTGAKKNKNLTNMKEKNYAENLYDKIEAI